MAASASKPVPYEEDFYAWTQDQAARLRARAHNGIDWENAAEEIESLGRSDRRELHSRLKVLVQHLLKWRYQAIRRKAGWRLTIQEQRDSIARVLHDSPSLRSAPADIVPEEYPRAVRDAADECRMRRDDFPPACPFTVEEILDPDFFPEAAA